MAIENLAQKISSLYSKILKADAFGFSGTPVMTSWLSSLDEENLSAGSPDQLLLVAEWSSEGLEYQQGVTTGNLIEGLERNESNPGDSLFFSTEDGEVEFKIYSLDPVSLFA